MTAVLRSTQAVSAIQCAVHAGCADHDMHDAVPTVARVSVIVSQGEVQPRNVPLVDQPGPHRTLRRHCTRPRSATRT